MVVATTGIEGMHMSHEPPLLFEVLVGVSFMASSVVMTLQAGREPIVLELGFRVLGLGFSCLTSLLSLPHLREIVIIPGDYDPHFEKH